MPTFNEIVNGFANKQTYERIQGVVHAGLEDIHNHAVRIKTLQSKPGVEGLIALAFPRLRKLIEEIENEDREKAVTEWSNRTSPSKDLSNSPTRARYPYSQVGSSGISSVGPSPAAKALYTAFGADVADRGRENTESQPQNG